MLGAVAGVLGAAIALALAQTYLEKSDTAKGRSDQGPAESKNAGLPEPDKSFKSRADGNWQAPLWQELSPQEAAKRAKRWFKK